MISLDTLQLYGWLASFGYTPFTPEQDYSHGDVYYRAVSFQNKKTDPRTLVIPGAGLKLKIWMSNQSEVIKPLNSELDKDGTIQFNQNLFINDDGFVISADTSNLGSLISYREENIFRRSAIHGVDDRCDLGDRIFIVSDAGILCSVYEFPMHKTLNLAKNSLNIFDEKFKPFAHIKYVIQKTLIGTYGNPLEVNAVHVFPKDNGHLHW